MKKGEMKKDVIAPLIVSLAVAVVATGLNYMLIIQTNQQAIQTLASDVKELHKSVSRVTHIISAKHPEMLEQVLPLKQVLLLETEPELLEGSPEVPLDMNGEKKSKEG